MRLRLTSPAARQLARVIDDIAQQHPPGARKVQERIAQVMNRLLQYPHLGHETERPSVRRFVVTPYPYAVTYSATDSEIIILGVRHTSRRPLV